MRDRMRAAVGEPAAQPPYLGYSWQCSQLTPGANPNPTRLGRVAPGSAEACLSCVQVGGRAGQAGRGYAKEPYQLVRLLLLQVARLAKLRFRPKSKLRLSG